MSYQISIDRDTALAIITEYYNVSPTEEIRQSISIMEEMDKLTKDFVKYLDQSAFLLPKDRLMLARTYACDAWKKRIDDIISKDNSFEPGNIVYSVRSPEHSNWIGDRVDLVAKVLDLSQVVEEEDEDGMMYIIPLENDTEDFISSTVYHVRRSSFRINDSGYRVGQKVKS